MVHIKSHQEFKSIFCFKTNMALYFMQVLALPQRWYTIIFSFGKSTFTPKLFITLNTPYCKYRTKPWAMSSSLGDNNIFFGPKHNIYALFLILFVLFGLILLFVCQICHANCETKNWKKRNLFKKNIANTDRSLWVGQTRFKSVSMLGQVSTSSCNCPRRYDEGTNSAKRFLVLLPILLTSFKRNLLYAILHLVKGLAPQLTILVTF